MTRQISHTITTVRAADAPDTIAPDGSEIRLLPSTDRASMAHCTLPPAATSLAVAHRTVEEIWFVLAGTGEIWRRDGDSEQVDVLSPGVGLSIPTGTHFQFRNRGAMPLQILIATMPAWPGADEAYRVGDHWRVE